MLGDRPEDRIDVGDIGDPRGIDGNRKPCRTGNDAKKDKRIQPARERQAREKRPTVRSAPDRKDHGCRRNGSQSEGRTWHQAKGKERGTYEDGGGHDSQCGPENTKVPGGRRHPCQSSSDQVDQKDEDRAQNCVSGP